MSGTESFRKRLCESAPHSTVRFDEPMDAHTSFRAGGRADALIQVADVAELFALLRLLLLEKVPYRVLGRGSNVLVSDRGYHGVILTLTGQAFREAEINGEMLRAGCAVTLAEAASLACEASLSGMEALSGIPGTVGGALSMNAGAYGTEMKDVVRTVTALDTERLLRDEADAVVTLTKGAMRFGYRTSVAKEERFLFLEAELLLTGGERTAIRARMQELQKKRREKQPLDLPSAGSSFKRPEGHFAGQLIEETGLKGFGIGGARVSEKHAGFIVNAKDATATDIIALLRHVRQRVKEHSGILLEPEVMILGEEL